MAKYNSWFWERIRLGLGCRLLATLAPDQEEEETCWKRQTILKHACFETYHSKKETWLRTHLLLPGLHQHLIRCFVSRTPEFLLWLDVFLITSFTLLPHRSTWGLRCNGDLRFNWGLRFNPSSSFPLSLSSLSPTSALALALAAALPFALAFTLGFLGFSPPSLAAGRFWPCTARSTWPQEGRRFYLWLGLKATLPHTTNIKQYMSYFWPCSGQSQDQGLGLHCCQQQPPIQPDAPKRHRAWCCREEEVDAPAMGKDFEFEEIKIYKAPQRTLLFYPCWLGAVQRDGPSSRAQPACRIIPDITRQTLLAETYQYILWEIPTWKKTIDVGKAHHTCCLWFH